MQPPPGPPPELPSCGGRLRSPRSPLPPCLCALVGQPRSWSQGKPRCWKPSSLPLPWPGHFLRTSLWPSPCPLPTVTGDQAFIRTCRAVALASGCRSWILTSLRGFPFLQGQVLVTVQRFLYPDPTLDFQVYLILSWPKWEYHFHQL